MMNKKIVTNIVRGIAIIFLSFSIYRSNIDGAFTFMVAMALGVWLFPWSVTYLLAAIFGEKKEEYDGILYIDRTQANDIYNISLNIEPEDFVVKSELKIKIDDMEET